ncbi:FecR family protein [Colwellia echini]|nr:FecR family protein [Colwellia echini]
MNISHKFKVTLSILPLVFCTLPSLAETSSAVDAEAVAGKTMIASGDVEALSNANDEKRKLKRRSEVFNSDVVMTGESSKTQLRMVDGSMIALKENTELIILEYQFNNGTEKNSAVLNLVTGGLRSITGAIKADEGQYQLKTPVGSIGIRGTHYQVEVLNDMMWIAVWDGAIDLLIDVGSQSGDTLSLGTDENYSYASIDMNGHITTYIEPPLIFKQGMSTKEMDIVETSGPDNLNVGASPTVISQPLTRSELNTALILNNLNENNMAFLSSDEFNSRKLTNVYDLVTAKEGSIKYSNAAAISTYELSNFAAEMTINFDTGQIGDGHMSFNDARSSEQWNALFNGNMNIRNDKVSLEVDVTFASHGDKLADGDISAGFVESLGLDGVVGQFELHEQNDDVSVNGSYLVKP